MGSWSWSESNFHKNDTFDVSYNDPNYQPSYDISGFTEDELDTGIKPYNMFVFVKRIT